MSSLCTTCLLAARRKRSVCLVPCHCSCPVITKVSCVCAAQEMSGTSADYGSQHSPVVKSKLGTRSNRSVSGGGDSEGMTANPYDNIVVIDASPVAASTTMSPKPKTVTPECAHSVNSVFALTLSRSCGAVQPRPGAHPPLRRATPRRGQCGIDPIGSIPISGACRDVTHKSGAQSRKVVVFEYLRKKCKSLMKTDFDYLFAFFFETRPTLPQLVARVDSKGCYEPL
jgi:hypothetical protein